ncbi:MAG: signal peptidase I [Spirochaetaceae bacterium]|nr:signal peptidase I [Spirochaetaceae bacterium]
MPHLIRWAVPVITAAAVAAVVHRYLLFTTVVSSHSMEPTIKPGDRLLTLRMYRRDKIRRQDKLVFYSRELRMVMVKRVVGLPGDSVNIQDDGTVHVNCEELKEPYLDYPGGPGGNFTVPARQYLMLGDNRALSNDGRSWSQPFIHKQDVYGRAVFRTFPLRRMGRLK